MSRKIVRACLASAMCAALSFGQEVRATLTGTVTDPSGAAVSNAVVTVTNVAQNVSVSTQTSPNGSYVTPYLAPGMYRVTAEQPGFKRAIRESVILQAQDRAR